MRWGDRLIAPNVYRDRTGLTRCTPCGHLAGHPVPCGARPVIGSRPCACPGTYVTSLPSAPTPTGAGEDSTAAPAPAPCDHPYEFFDADAHKWVAYGNGHRATECPQVFA